MSKERKESSILAYFGDLPDPRIERCKRHQLLDIIAIGICAVICGADSYVEMQEFGRAKREWFETFLELKNGIPSHDTFRRVFGKPEADGVSVLFSGMDQVGARDDEGRSNCD